MKTNSTTNNSSGIGIDSSMQYKALDEIVSMIQSLTSMMNQNLPGRMTHETAYAIGDLNQLVDNLRIELEMVKIKHTRIPAKEISRFVVTKIGELLYEKR